MDATNKRIVAIPEAGVRYCEMGQNKVYIFVVQLRDKDGNLTDQHKVLLSCTEDRLTAQFSAMAMGLIKVEYELYEGMKELAQAIAIDLERIKQ